MTFKRLLSDFIKNRQTSTAQYDINDPHVAESSITKTMIKHHCDFVIYYQKGSITEQSFCKLVYKLSARSVDLS